jgi:hypothetical protein
MELSCAPMSQKAYGLSLFTDNRSGAPSCDAQMTPMSFAVHSGLILNAHTFSGIGSQWPAAEYAPKDNLPVLAYSE